MGAFGLGWVSLRSLRNGQGVVGLSSPNGLGRAQAEQEIA